VWFRLQLMNNIWTPYTSLDGSTWTMAGTPQLVEFVGAWVGVFATSANAKQQIQAVFDHISGFAPTTQVPHAGQAGATRHEKAGGVEKVPCRRRWVKQVEEALVLSARTQV